MAEETLSDRIKERFVLFFDTELVTRGMATEVVLAAYRVNKSGRDGRLAVFSERTGMRLDINLEGSQADVLARLSEHPVLGAPAQPKRGRGRPKLGVVSREVSLLPRHWDWLAEQRGGASAALRRLVEAARKGDSAAAAQRQAVEAAHRFLWDIAGNLPGFEEASRALFAGDVAQFESQIKHWPVGIAEQALRFVRPA